MEHLSEAAKREAEAQIRLVEASAKSITDISEDIKDNDLPAVFPLPSGVPLVGELLDCELA